MQTRLDKRTIAKLGSLTMGQVNQLVAKYLDSNTLERAEVICFRMVGETYSYEPDEVLASLLAELASSMEVRVGILASYLLTQLFSDAGLEAYWQLRLQWELGGVREVRVPCGRIDLLTTDRIIEVKHCKGWKHALGQVLCYSVFRPGYKPTIALYGQLSSKEAETATFCCNKLGVDIMFIK